MTGAPSERMLNTEHGERRLRRRQRFHQRPRRLALAKGGDALDGLRSATLVPRIVGVERLHQFPRKPHSDAAVDKSPSTIDIHSNPQMSTVRYSPPLCVTPFPHRFVNCYRLACLRARTRDD